MKRTYVKPIPVEVPVSVLVESMIETNGVAWTLRDVTDHIRANYPKSLDNASCVLLEQCFRDAIRTLQIGEEKDEENQ